MPGAVPDCDRIPAEAEVGATTVRDFESQRRATDTGAMSQLRQAFENAGVVFVSGAADAGPGGQIRGWPSASDPTTRKDDHVGPFFREWRARK
jgi:hypothetical protein